MAESFCDLFKRLLADLAAHPQDPKLAQMTSLDRAVLREHVDECDICAFAVDDVEYPEDEGLASDMSAEIVSFLSCKEDDMTDEESLALVNVFPVAPDAEWGMN